MKSLPAYLLIAYLAIGFMGCSSPKETGQKADHAVRTLESVFVDSVTADFPVRFSFLLRQNQQFVGYYNKDRYLTVASKQIGESNWTYQILPSQVGWDSHNSITMAFDKEDHLHVSGNMHNDTLVYFKTRNPLDITSLERVLPQVSIADEHRCTYPRFMTDLAGDLLFTYRIGGSGNGVKLTNRYDTRTRTFSRLTDAPLYNGLGEMSAYQRGPTRGPDGAYHLIWLWRDTPGCETNHDLSYARSSDLIHWENIGGSPKALPITPRDALFTVDPVPPKGGAINGACKLFFGPDQEALIAYMKYDQQGNSQLFLAAAHEGSWKSHQLSKWTYRWAFEGPGSIDFHIKIRDASTTPDGNLRIAYWHIKRGHGELIVDPHTYLLLDDRSVVPAEEKLYPPELTNSTSGLEGAMVRWLAPAPIAEEAGEYFSLRWETQEKQRRYYKAPAQPVAPTAMILYRFAR